MITPVAGEVNPEATVKENVSFVVAVTRKFPLYSLGVLPEIVTYLPTGIPWLAKVAVDTPEELDKEVNALLITFGLLIVNGVSIVADKTPVAGEVSGPTTA
jgi:hypothetical protein